MNKVIGALIDLIDTLHLHRGDEIGSYTMINTGEMNQSIERAMETLRGYYVEKTT